MDGELLHFSFPSELRVQQVSEEPRTFRIEDDGHEFSIAVSIDNGLQGSNDPNEILKAVSEHVTPEGPTRDIRVGRSRGLKQRHRFMDGFKFLAGETTVLVSDRGRLVFRVDFLEQHESELKPVFHRVTQSLRFDDATLAATRTQAVTLEPSR